MYTRDIFNISTTKQFNSLAIEIFQHQYINNPIYQRFCNLLGVSKNRITKVSQIPYLPIEFFKKETLITGNAKAEVLFTSSGTTGSTTSTHYVTDINVYEESFRKGFTHFYGDIKDYCVIALLPAYLERTGSSLVYMANDFIKQSKHPKSGFYLTNLEELVTTLKQLQQTNQKTLLIGVSFALLDLAEQYSLNLKNVVVMETGGMKGRRKELIRSELHQQLSKGLGVTKIHSEYGMTELLSQAYSKGNGIFTCPPWMQVSVRNTENPLQPLPFGKNGGLNIIDLANINSCSFIATQDLGKVYPDHSFEVLGRFDHSDIRGCNLLVL